MKKILFMLLCAANSVYAIETVETIRNAYIVGFGNVLHALVDYCENEKLSPVELDLLAIFFVDCVMDSPLTAQQMLAALRYRVNGQDVITHAKARHSDYFVKKLAGIIEFFETMVAYRIDNLTSEEIYSNKIVMAQMDKLAQHLGIS